MDSDAGWQIYKEKKESGLEETMAEIYGTEVRILFHWEISAGCGPEGEYPVIDHGFVGDEQKLFDVTGLLDDAHIEIICQVIYEESQDVG